MRIRRSVYPIRSRNLRNHQSGVALIIALLSLLIVSTLAAGLMFSTQSEIWTTANYRAVTEARYAAEAGVQQAALFLSTHQNGWAPLSGGFNLTNLPVTYNTTNNYVVLAPTGSNAISGITDTYSATDSATDAAFAALSTTLSPFASIAGKPNFAVAAQLISAYNDPQAGWITSWKIISQGTVSGVRQAKVQVVATIQNKVVPGAPGGGLVSVPAFKFGAWANGTDCKSIEMSGSSNTQSFNSSTSGGVSNPPLTAGGSDVATLGGVYLHNSAMIDGNVFAPNYNLGNPTAGYTPKKGSLVSTYYPYGVTGGSGPDSSSNGWNADNKTVQHCSVSWPYAVEMDNSGGTGFGCTDSNSSNCANKASKLPTGYTTPYPTAAMPSDAPTTNVTSTCNFGSECAGNYGTGSLTMPPKTTSYGQVTFGSDDDYYLSAGNYYFDTLTITSSGRIHVTSNPVVIYILNGANSTTPLQFTGGSETNKGGNPNTLTFVYNGTKTVDIGSISNNAVFATIYAPNANINFHGNGNIYGAVIGNTVSLTGGGHLNYDTNLANSTPTVKQTGGISNQASPFHITEFSWSAF